MNGRIWLTLLAAVAALWPVSGLPADDPGYIYAPTPTWVQQVTIPDTRQAQAEASRYYVLLVDHQQRISTDGEGERFRRLALQPLSQGGVEEVAELELDFDPAYQTLTLHSVRVHRSGTVTDRYDPDKVSVLQREQDLEMGLYYGRKTLFIPLDDIRPGDIVEYSYTVSGTNPILGNEAFGGFVLGFGEPAERIFNRLLIPRKRDLDFKTFGTKAKSGQSNVGDDREYVWDISPAEKVEAYGDEPSWHYPYPWVQFSEYDDWEEVVEWAIALYPDVSPPGQEFRQAINALRAPGQSTEQLIASALYFVQDDVRYLGIEHGESSHRPSAPDETLSRRFGDCKDKTVLLVTMLRDMGVDAWPALVSTTETHQLPKQLPNPGAFNHVIAMVETNGRTYWLDPTLTYQRGGLGHQSFPDYGYALPVRPGQDDLVRMQVPARYRLTISESFRPVPETDQTEAAITSVYEGGYAERLRRAVADVGAAEYEKHLLGAFQQSYPGAEVAIPAEIGDDELGNRITIVERYRTDGFWDDHPTYRRGELFAGAFSDLVKLPARQERQAPLAVEYPLEIVQHTTVDLPDGLADSSLAVEDEDLAVEMPAFLFRRHVENSETSLTVTHEFTTRADHVSVDDLEQHYAALKETRSALSTVLVTPTSAQARAEARQDRLQNALRKLMEKGDD